MTNTDKQEWEKEYEEFLLAYAEGDHIWCTPEELSLLLRHVAESEYKRGVEDAKRDIKKQLLTDNHFRI